MDRRSFLATVGAATLAGCFGSSGGDGVPTVTIGSMDTLSAQDKGCDPEATNSGTVSIDGRQVTVEGTVLGKSLCARPSGQVLVGAGPTEGKVTIVVESFVSSERDCQECDRFIDYTGTVELDEVPDDVALEHVTREGAQTEVASVDPQATATATPADTPEVTASGTSDGTPDGASTQGTAGE